MRTVGVEEELLLVDPETGEPLSLATAVVAVDGLNGHEDRDDRDDEPGGTLERELQLQQIEVDTHPHTDLGELATAVVECRARAVAAAEQVGAAVAAIASSPLLVTPRTTPARRYLQMAERFGLTGSEQLTCGLHVHVSIESDDEGVAVLDRIRTWLPVLVALSANSPFWRGVDSGYASFRSQVWSRWPTAGPLELLGSSEAYHRLMDRQLRTRVPMDAAMLYSDARLSARYPTVEVRVPDVCLRAEDSVLVAALARGLVDTAAGEWQDGREPDDAPAALIRLATWQAGRFGLDGDLVDPRTGDPQPARLVLDALLDHVRPALERAGDLDAVDQGLRSVLERGTGAARQRAAMERDGTLASVVRDAIAVTTAPLGDRA